MCSGTSLLSLLLEMGSQRPSPHVKTLCNSEPQIWPEIITARDAEKALVFKAQGL